MQQKARERPYVSYAIPKIQLASNSTAPTATKLLVPYYYCPINANVNNQGSDTVQILCIGTDRSQQTVQTKIRLLLKKQSDQGLRCLPFHQHLLDALMQC